MKHEQTQDGIGKNGTATEMQNPGGGTDESYAHFLARDMGEYRLV